MQDDDMPVSYDRAVWDTAWRDAGTGLFRWSEMAWEFVLGAIVSYLLAAYFLGPLSTDAFFAAAIGAPATIILRGVSRVAFKYATAARCVYYDDQAAKRELASKLRQATAAEPASLIWLRDEMLRHAATAPDAARRNTDTVDNWQTRVLLLIETHLVPGFMEKYQRCKPECIQSELEESRASFEAIAVNLSAADLK